MERYSYFLISVSTRTNLDWCLNYALAGFPNSISGVWTFLEVCEGDFVSFLYAARARNLYQVVKREAIMDAEKLPPWKPITFRSGRTYYFPFRIWLKPVRLFDESLVKAEFAYVAENLLLRGGYRRTHFQADQTTLQSASQMGTPFSGDVQPLAMPYYQTFVPSFTRAKNQVQNPQVFLLSEVILQAAIRQHLLERNHLSQMLQMLGITSLSADQLEVLGEKALPEGHVDILVKESIPIGRAMKIPVEVKLGTGQVADVRQLRAYMNEFGADECPAGALVASGFNRAAVREAHKLGIKPVRYLIELDWQTPRTFDEIRQGLWLEPVQVELS
jgi:hypothetical protein